MVCFRGTTLLGRAVRPTQSGTGSTDPIPSPQGNGGRRRRYLLRASAGQTPARRCRFSPQLGGEIQRGLDSGFQPGPWCEPFACQRPPPASLVTSARLLFPFIVFVRASIDCYYIGR